MQDSSEHQTILSEIEDLKNKQQLNRKERRRLEKLEKKLYGDPSVNSKRFDGFGKYAIYVFITIGIVAAVGGAWVYLSKEPTLPPIDMAGHVEQNPKSHILNSPMSESIQKHMLEHADGDAKNGEGVIIQYNCTKPYICEEGLVDKLKGIVKIYPKNVYLAPGNYKGLIVLTKLGKREILDSYDEQKITSFVTNK